MGHQCVGDSYCERNVSTFSAAGCLSVWGWHVPRCSAHQADFYCGKSQCIGLTYCHRHIQRVPFMIPPYILFPLHTYLPRGAAGGIEFLRSSHGGKLRSEVCALSQNEIWNSILVVVAPLQVTSPYCVCQQLWNWFKSIKGRKSNLILGIFSWRKLKIV